MITHVEKAWLKRKWGKLRKSQMAADKASNEWQDMNASFNDWCLRMEISDPVQIAKVKGENLSLKDALATWDWHSREATRHAQDIQAFKSMKDMGAL